MQPVPRLLDPNLDAVLERDGYAVIPRLLGPTEIEQLLQVFRSNDSAIHRMPFGASILSEDTVLRARVDHDIKAIMGLKLAAAFNSYRLSFANFLSKTPQIDGKAGEVQPHQDPTFVDETRFQSLGFWCPLTNVDMTNGCLYVLPESHRLNPGPRTTGTLPFPYRELVPLLKSKLRPVPMAAGDALIFCQKLFHASQPNRGIERRVVVGGLCVPRDAQLYCYYTDPTSPRRIEVFEVDDLFYTRYIYGARPEGVPRVGTIDYWYEPLTADRMSAIP